MVHKTEILTLWPFKKKFADTYSKILFVIILKKLISVACMFCDSRLGQLLQVAESKGLGRSSAHRLGITSKGLVDPVQ